jgi:ABC-2 type transport system ATP-binding protein
MPDDRVVLRGVTKTYPSPAGPVRAVRGVDLVLEPGESVALLGPNGAGKSTTIDMLLGLTPPDDGGVETFGHTARGAVEAGLVGAMLQSGALIRDLSVRELVELAASLQPQPLPVAEILAAARIEDIAERRTQRLSGGQAQRVRFAIAIAGDPDLLVLDEPTAGMDVESRIAFWGTVRQIMARGTTVLFATHYLEEADANAGRIVLMARGVVVADGTPTHIKGIVGQRRIRATLPDVPAADLAALPGVADAQRDGDAVTLVCRDSDAALRALLSGYPAAHDLEVTGAGLEEAFLALTADDEEAA